MARQLGALPGGEILVDLLFKAQSPFFKDLDLGVEIDPFLPGIIL